MVTVVLQVPQPPVNRPFSRIDTLHQLLLWCRNSGQVQSIPRLGFDLVHILLSLNTETLVVALWSTCDQRVTAIRAARDRSGTFYTTTVRKSTIPCTEAHSALMEEYGRRRRCTITPLWLKKIVRNRYEMKSKNYR